MMKVFSKCSVVLFGLMFFFGNSDSCHGMETKYINSNNTENQGNNEGDKDSFLGYVFSWKCWKVEDRDINEAYELNFWAFVDILRHNCGFYLKRKTLKYGEWFLGSSIGIGWYPQFLNFHKHFRIGFFEAQYNFLSLITYILKNVGNKNINIEYKGSWLYTLVPPINVSIINFQIYNGFIKIKFFDIGFIIMLLLERNRKYDLFDEHGIKFFQYGDEFCIRAVFPEDDKDGLNLNNIFLPEIYINLSGVSKYF